ncbi:MAG: hypothetical protein RIF41_17385 [Polyangiaceae bacterium]
MAPLYRLLPALLIPVALPACMSFGSREHFDAHHRAHLSQRAGYELNCSEQDLTFTPLGARSVDGGDYTTVGVSGCGRRITYRRHMQEWIPTVAGQGEPAGAGDASPEQGQSPTAASLAHYVMESPDVQVVIGPRQAGQDGFGGTTMTMDGTSVWPPSGDATCERLVSCCDQRLAEDERFELLCPFAIIKHRDCSTALETVNTIGAELGRPRRDACTL